MRNINQIGKRIVKICIAFTMLYTAMVSGVEPLYAQDNTPSEYEIYPIPHRVNYDGGSVVVGDQINVVISSQVDEASVNYLKSTLSLLDSEVTISNKLTDGTNVLVGIAGNNDLVNTTANYEPKTDALFTKYDSNVVKVSDQQILLLGNDNDAVYCAITTLKIMLEQSKNNTILKTTIEDYADVQYRGIIEGYYGIPYSNENIISLMEFGSRVKLNTFIYAPKDDPYHNSRWREAYPQEKLDEMQELIEAGTRTKTRFVYAIHPFMSNGIKKNDFDTEIKHITDKFEILYDLGVRQFSLLADDASSETALQVKTINALTEWLESKEGTYPIIFCPQAYSGTPGASYYNQFRDGTKIAINGVEEQVPAIDDEVEMMYTGPAIIGNVDQASNAKYAKESGRNPYIWLNWPVNDYTDSTLFIGKAEMLKKADNLNGLVSNPMTEAQLSKIGLFQIADYAWNTKAFDMDKSWDASFKVVDKDVEDDLRIVAKHMSYPREGVYHQTGLAWEESEDLAPIIDALEAKLDANENAKDEAIILKAELEKIIEASNRVVANSKNSGLVTEYTPYHTSIVATLQANISGLDSIIAYTDSDYDEAWLKYSDISAKIEASNRVTKPGLKPGGNVNLEVKPGTKYLRPLSNYLNTKVGQLMDSVIGIAPNNTAKPYYHFSGFKTTDAEMNKITDNDLNTYASLENSTQKLGDYYGVDLGSVSDLSHVSILQGPSSGGQHDIFHYAILEASKDGTTWTTIADYSENAAGVSIEVDTNVSARYVRLRLTKEGFNNKPDYWLYIRDFSVSYNQGDKIYTNCENTTGAELVKDDTNSILTLNDFVLKADQYVGIKLTAIKHFDMEALEAAHVQLEYSENSKEWVSASNKNNIKARYVRLLNTGEQDVALSGTLKLSVSEIKDASVDFNSAAYGEVDTYEPVNDQNARKIFGVADLENKQHTLTVFTKRSETDLKASVDRFEVLNGEERTQVNIAKNTAGLTLFTDNSPNVADWASWSPKAGWLNNDEMYLANSTGGMVYTFTGTGIELWGAFGNNLCKYEYFIDGIAYDGTQDFIFDGKDATMAHYKTDQVTIDLGQGVDVNSLQVKVAENIANEHPDWMLGKGQVQVSENGTDWTNVRSFNITDNAVSASDDTFDEHEAPYFWMDIRLDKTKAVKYVRLALEDVKEFVVNEISINDGMKLSKNENYEISSTQKETAENLLSYVLDKKLDTGFKVISDGKAGNIELKLTEEGYPKQTTIVQSANTISNANVEIYENGTWTKIGVLDKSINVFDITKYKNATKLRISYDHATNFTLLEISYQMDDEEPITSYQVTFISDGNEVVQSVDAGKKVEKPTDPIKTGHKFLGWYTNDGLFDFDTPINSNIVLNAKFEKIDVSALEDLLAKTAELVESNYTVDSWKDLQDVIQTANELLAGNYTEAQIVEKCEQLSDAMTNLVDKSELIAIINRVEKMDTSIFTEASVNHLNDKLADGKSVLNKNNASKADIKGAVDAIEKAVKDLSLKPTVDKTVLQDKLNEISDLMDDLNSKNYTEESWNALLDAIKNAEAVLEDNDTTQADVENAIKELVEKYSGLEKITVTQPDDNKDESGNNVDTNDTTNATALWLTMLLSTVAFVMIKKSNVAKEQ